MSLGSTPTFSIMLVDTFVQFLVSPGASGDSDRKFLELNEKILLEWALESTMVGNGCVEGKLEVFRSVVFYPISSAGGPFSKGLFIMSILNIAIYLL